MDSEEIALIRRCAVEMNEALLWLAAMLERLGREPAARRALPMRRRWMSCSTLEAEVDLTALASSLPLL